MKTRHGFALVELAALGVVASLVAALLLVFGAETRRAGRLGEDIGKLRRIGALTGQYAADNADLFWTFSWKKGQSLSQWPDLNNATSDTQASINQMVDILRRRAGRTDVPQLQFFIPQISYSQLTLLDYAERVPDECFVSSADTNRLKWLRDPHGFDQGLYQPAPAGAPGTGPGKRWPYSTSFPLETAFYDRSRLELRVTQASTHSSYFLSADAILRGKTTAAVVFPAHKVLMHDNNARHFGIIQPYCTYAPWARLPLLFVDGSALVKSAAESNLGWSPRSTSSALTAFDYQPDAWEPATVSGNTNEHVIGRFRWTRGFLDGRDFGGPEACTGQPGCP
ncbi:MAG: hypothetical protein IT437_06490 [Phycisphaerales bacterium]|nr:hypothetical protein [Phycisphaerales bacterium]